MGSPGESQEEGQETDVLFFHILQCDGLTGRLGFTENPGECHEEGQETVEALCFLHFSV